VKQQVAMAEASLLSSEVVTAATVAKSRFGLVILPVKMPLEEPLVLLPVHPRMQEVTSAQGEANLP
jgi:hypothetical protein